MAKGQDGSVAPKERINISFKPAGSDKNEEVEAIEERGERLQVIYHRTSEN